MEIWRRLVYEGVIEAEGAVGREMRWWMIEWGLGVFLWSEWIWGVLVRDSCEIGVLFCFELEGLR